MSTRSDSEKGGLLQGGFAKKTPLQAWALVVLVVALIGFMGAYFWASYRIEHSRIPIQEKMLSQHDDLFGICKGRAGQAWAVGKNGLILHTKDEGRNWEQQESGTVQALSAVSFANDQVGFVVGAGGIILGTRDGGLSWKMQSSRIKDYLLGVQVLDENRAYAVGAFGTFLSTSDGGTTWMKQKFSWEKLIPGVIEEIREVEPNLNAVYFVTPEIGWIAGEFGLILHTRDAGQNWTVQRSGVKLAPLFAIIFLDRQRAWAMGQLGSLIWTRDGGQNWFPSKFDIKKSLYAASAESERMVVVGDHVLLRSKDGGSTWARKDFSENIVLNGVAILSKSPTVVGQAGLIRQMDIDAE